MTHEESSTDAPLACLFKIVVGPTYKSEHSLLPTLCLPSRRFASLLIQKGDAGQLAPGLNTLMGDAALRRRLDRAAKRRTENEYCGESYLKLFEELIVASLHASSGSAPARTAVT